MSNDSVRASPELREVAEFVGYIEKTVRESEIGLSPESVRQIKSRYLDLRMKAEVDIRNVPAFMHDTVFRKMKELNALELRLETALMMGADKYKLHEMKVSCRELQNAINTYKTLVYVLASALATLIAAIIAKISLL